MCFVKELALLICLFDDLYANDLWASGDAEAKVFPKKEVVKGNQQGQLLYNDYVVVSDTVEGLGVPSGGAPTGGSAAGSKPADQKKKRKIEEKAAVAGERKRRKLRTNRTAAVTQSKPAVVTGK
ncbi:hypothetical protein Hanom_Chr08g00695781 [Helianthus anomalus]